MSYCSQCGRNRYNGCTCSGNGCLAQISQTILLAVVIMFLVMLIALLAPGIALNLLIRRFADHPDGLLSASLSDAFTWIFSIVFWIALGIWYSTRGSNRGGIITILLSRLSGSSVSESAGPTEIPSVTAIDTGKTNGPFGLHMGMKPDALPSAKSHHGPDYIYDRLPRGHSYFNQYRLTYGSTIGLCCVTACATDIPMNDGGYKLVAMYREVLSMYEQRYGTYTERDRTVSSAYTKFINVQAEWLRGTGANLPPNVTSLTIVAQRTSDSRGEVCVHYYYSNYAAFEGNERNGMREDEEKFI